jgi:hypothetical protein
MPLPCSPDITTIKSELFRLSEVNSAERWLDISTPYRLPAAKAFSGELRLGPINPADAVLISPVTERGRTRAKTAAAKGLRQIFP